MPFCPIRSRQLITLPFLLLLASLGHAHGGVVGINDLCVINIGYLKAHFKIYVPQETGHSEYCEDIPVRGESVFVMEYQHDSLNEAQIDFRIIRNITGKSTFARIEDVAAIDDIDAITVHYAPPAVVPAVYTLLHTFDEDGEYIGIVSAANTGSDRSHMAVFPFEVGYTGLGVWPWVFAALLALQFNYWFMSRRRNSVAASILLLAMLGTAGSANGSDGWQSDAARFEVRFESELDPIVINQMHKWILHIRHADGRAVANAEIGIRGGMPEHNHGLPTVPRVVRNLGDGRYELAGMRFHMNGYWEIHVTIDDGSHRDTVTIPLSL